MELDVRFEVPMKTRFQQFETAIKLQLLGRCSISPNGSVTRT